MYFSCFIWSSLQYWIATPEEMQFFTYWFTTETTAKGGRKLKKRRKGQFQQSYILASLTCKSSPKPADIQITAGNYEGEVLAYNTSWRKCQEVKEVSTKAAEKAFESVIPFLEEGRKTTCSQQWNGLLITINEFNMYLFLQHIQIKYYHICIP